MSYPRKELSGWGRYPVTVSEVVPANSKATMADAMASVMAGTKASAMAGTTGRTISGAPKAGKSLIARGYGRSYGDSALADRVLDMRCRDRMLAFDENEGLLDCESGVLLSEIIETFLPQGWFPMVTPGTRYTTVGGAIAADVHGKNHHRAGCFSESVTDLELMLPDGETLLCSRTENEELFRATCGGMGLTGLILRARLRLQSVPSRTIRQTTVRTKDLEATFEAFREYAAAPYSVAWVDCLARGRNLGRSLLMLGEFDDTRTEQHENREEAAIPGQGAGRKPFGSSLRIPRLFPGFLLNRFSVAAFNELYYRKVSAGISAQRVGLEPFFYPLDRLRDWNRIYGRQGFLQYQFILPLEQSEHGMRKILTEISHSGMGSFLAVLKLYGPANDNLLSFPLEGYSLALDFKRQRGLDGLLERLDRLVVRYGGRIYLAKDARMSRDVFESGYPGLETFRKLRVSLGLNRCFHSLQSLRLGL